MTRAIGIDLGLTSTKVAAMSRGQPVLLNFGHQKTSVPSVIARNVWYHWVLRDDANTYLGNAKTNFVGTMRFIGLPMRNTVLQFESGFVPYRVESLLDGGAGIVMDNAILPPAHVVALFLRAIKERTEWMIGEPVTHAAITVPEDVRADVPEDVLEEHVDEQLSETKYAGRLAGMDLFPIKEPKAAAFAYRLDPRDDRTLGVFSLSAGKLEVSVLRSNEGKFRTLSSVRDDHLGGRDFDQRIIDWIINRFRKREGVDLRTMGHPWPMLRVRDEAERMKIDLSSRDGARTKAQLIMASRKQRGGIYETLTRSEFELMSADLLDRITALARRAVANSEWQVDRFEEVLLIGGQTRMPAVRERIKKVFGKEPISHISPEHAVALGAAFYAGIRTGDYAGSPALAKYLDEQRRRR